MNTTENTKKKLTIAYSPCPNDTFIFYAMIHHLITCNEISFKVIHKDVEQLNQSARNAMYDITKLSFHAAGHLLDNYGLLRTGSALGYNCGPLIVAPKGSDLSLLSNVKIAVPGEWTTANLLLGLYLKQKPEIISMPFDTIMPAIQKGQAQVGVIIHEGRFTYERFGLTCLLDLGQWWEKETNLPIPLGCIALKRELSHLAPSIEQCMIKSIEFSQHQPEKAASYIKHYAQETEEDVIRQHIDLYVNNNTRLLDETGIKAIETLFKKAYDVGMIPNLNQKLFCDETPVNIGGEEK